VSIEAMKQALEALTCSDEHDDPGHRCSHCDDYVDRNGPVRAALRAAITEAAMQQLTDVQQAIETAVADQAIYGMGITLGGKRIDPASIYKEPFPEKIWEVVPPRREWAGLTDEEIKEIIGPWGDTPIKGYTRKLFDQIEAKLKEKNS